VDCDHRKTSFGKWLFFDGHYLGGAAAGGKLEMRKSSFFEKTRVIAIIVKAILLTTTGFAQPANTLHPATGPIDHAELEAFMDGIVEAQLEAYNIAGAVFAVVKDGALFIAKGYGFADLKERKRVQADKTLFRIASISKLFVWTAIMQLVEQEKLDLNTDINNYLTQFKIPDTHDEPVTLTHLMTHTAGFEDYVTGLFSKATNRLLPLEDILAHELPVRVRPPGDVISYSNHGTAIAAHIVEKVSRKTWDDYVEESILRPLAMNRTTFRQPVPETLSANVSKGYTYSDGEFREEAFVYVPLAPVASASTTATDMANFMIAHLNHGRFDNSRILNAEIGRQMHSALFRQAPEVNPMAHGFFDISRNGRRVIGHGGNILYFHSQIALLPEQKVGLFVAYNSEGGRKAARETYELFMNRYYPPEDMQVLTPSENSINRLRRLTGRYFSTRRVHERLTKLGALLGTVTVTLSEDGALKTMGPKTTRWIEMKPLTFREEYGHRTLVFREDEKGRGMHMFMGDLPYMALERVSMKDSPILHIVLAITAILFFFTATVSWPFAALIRWRHNVKLNRRARIPRMAYLLAWSASFLFIVVAAFLALGLRDPNAIVFGIPIWIKAVLMLVILSAIITAGSIIYMVIIWKSGKGSTWDRVYYTAVMLALSVTIWQLNHWNLLGFPF
jgi:CubicO group peptidase (beta-lactamase class C family)